MITILIRTVIIYLILTLTMRLMGKRQLGELEPSELVTTFLLSEIASLPITNLDIPIMFAIIPIITLLSLEVFASVLLIKVPALKNLLSPRPNVIIEKGKLRQDELQKLRISTDELLSELRQSGVTDISEVYYAILEENGKLSVIPKAKHTPPTAKQLGIPVTECGISHILISDGKLNRHGIKTLGLSSSDIKSFIEENDLSVKDVFLLTKNDGGYYNIILKEKSSK